MFGNLDRNTRFNDRNSPAFRYTVMLKKCALTWDRMRKTVPCIHIAWIYFRITLNLSLSLSLSIRLHMSSQYDAFVFRYHQRHGNPEFSQRFVSWISRLALPYLTEERKKEGKREGEINITQCRVMWFRLSRIMGHLFLSISVYFRSRSRMRITLSRFR